MAIRITADSTCDLGEKLVEKHEITIIPLYINLGDESFKDGLEINPERIFEYVKLENKLPKTSAVPVGDYEDVFKKLISEGHSVIHISISSEFSTSYNNAVMAAQDAGGEIYVVNSLNLSTGSGHTVLKAAELIEAGMDAKEIADFLEGQYVPRVEASFCIDTLKYLHMGGRCSTLAALGANLLKLKPCIEVNDGKMTVGKKYRGSLEKVLLEYVKDRLHERPDIEYERIFVTHTGCSPEIIKSVTDEIKRYSNFKEMLETTAGCTITSHCGPGTLGILFLRSK